LSKEEKGQAYALSAVLYIITAITIIGLMNYDRLKGVYSSGLLFIFWLFVFLASIPDIGVYPTISPQHVSYLPEHLEQQ
jgi:uncharacterized membrane protein YkgB